METVLNRSGGRFEVDPELLAGDAQRLGEEIQALKRCSGRMYEEMGRLEGMWEGEAKQEFLRGFLQDYQALEYYISFLSGLRSSLENAVRGYAACEQAVCEALEGWKTEISLR